MQQRRWGIYTGFLGKNNPAECWREPDCERCTRVLRPWIDWVWHGSIGYCSRCEDFKIVESNWEPVPGVNPRAEMERLVSHKVQSLELFGDGFDESPWLWELHDLVPIDQQMAISVDQSRRQHRGSSESLVILEHMFWSLIWNSECLFPELLRQYLEFAFEHPHYVTYRGCEIWIGHEANLVEALEKNYSDEIVHCLYDIYCNTDINSEEFRRRLGLYVPRSDNSISQYGADFLKYAQLSRVRPANPSAD